MRARWLPIAGVLYLLVSAAAVRGEKKEEIVFGEGVDGGLITDGVNQWEVTGAAPDDGTFNDFEVPIGTDHQFSTWWWYRVAGDPAETRMPPPDTEDYTGDTATFTWSDVDGRGLFDAMAVVRIFLVAPGSVLVKSFTATNISGGNLDLHVFAYADMDLDATAGDDSATELSRSRIEITDATTAYFIVTPDPEAYRVDSFPLVRDALNDGLVDDFADTGLPFGPGDYTGAFQWKRVIPAGDGFLFSTANCVNLDTPCFFTDPFFADGFETGDTSNWDTTIP